MTLYHGDLVTITRISVFQLINVTARKRRHLSSQILLSPAAKITPISATTTKLRSPSTLPVVSGERQAGIKININTTISKARSRHNHFLCERKFDLPFANTKKETWRQEHSSMKTRAPTPPCELLPDTGCVECVSERLFS